MRPVPSLKVQLCVAALVLWGCRTPEVVVVKEVDFKSELKRYGGWLVVQPFGRVWHPHAQVVGDDFVPYSTGGGWVYGPSGWTFESRWPWGEFVFHSGRWFQADDLGWLWWPDQAKGPAWVQWRSGDGHIGWSPTPPPGPASRFAPATWTYVKIQHLSAKNSQPFQVPPATVVRLNALAEPLPAAGPNVEQVTANGGMERSPPPIEAPPAVVPPPPEPEEKPAPPPPPAKAKKKKKH
jgi:hypothetical protein